MRGRLLDRLLRGAASARKFGSSASTSAPSGGASSSGGLAGASGTSTSTSSSSGWGGSSGGKGSVFEAAEARMQKLRVQAVQQEQAAGAGQKAPKGLGQRVLGVLGDAVLLSAVGAAGFAAYYSLAYKDTRELEQLLQDTCQAEGIAVPGSRPQPPPTPPPAPPPPPPPSSSSRAARPSAPAHPTTLHPQAAPSSSSSDGSSSRSSTEAGPNPFTHAWCLAMGSYLRARTTLEDSINTYTAPTYHKLLPDMAPELKGRVKTLVLDLDDVLVHKEWTRQMGWKIFKRPGVQDFLFEMGGYFEVVLFTDEPSAYAEPIINKLDPYRMVLYRLYRPETQYHKGKHVRDLSKLNRDLSQVLMISANPEAWEFQPENTIKLKPWDASTQDTALLDLIPMLQLIATKGVRDVRDVVKSYDGEEDIAAAFKRRMSQLSSGQQGKQAQKQGAKGFLGSLASTR